MPNPAGYQLTRNWNTREFQCKCGCGFGLDVNDLDLNLVHGLQDLRNRLGRPLYCVLKDDQGLFHPAGSGARCTAHNRAVGGSTSSYHLYGRAADVWGVDWREIARQALFVPEFAQGGIITYPVRRFVHLDTRPRPYHHQGTPP